MPSMTPTVTMLAPSTETMKIGSRLWTSSDEASMKNDTMPRIQMSAGSERSRDGLEMAVDIRANSSGTLATVRSPRSAGHRFELLIRIWIRRRPLHAIEAERHHLMAAVARGGQGIKGARERSGIALLDGRTKIAEWRSDHLREHVLRRNGRILVRRMKLDHVIETFADFVELIRRQLP